MTSGATDSFPRGGTRIIRKRKPEDNLFPTEKPPKAKKQRKNERKLLEPPTDKSWIASLNLQGTLTYSKLQEGMIILSCVRHITNLAVKLEFPGLTYAQVTINCISDAFTENITDKLKDKSIDEPSDVLKKIFQLGQLVPAKIYEILKTEKGLEIRATINPKDINAEINCSAFKKGSTVWGNVLSELDHGYELSVGVKNCRVFLPFKNVDDGKKYEVGEPLYCVVHKFHQLDSTVTLTVSAKKEHLDRIQIDESQDLTSVIPGTKIELVVEKASSHGIKGKFLDNCYGYVDETQMFSKIKPSKLSEGHILPAYVLYREPLTKITFLTLRGLEILQAPKLETGEVQSAHVASILPRGLHLKLGSGEMGYISNKRILKMLPKGSEIDIIKRIKKKYPVGTKHDCRILDFNRMQQLYICTFESKLIKEKLFTVKDFKLGQLVTVQVHTVVPNGLIVSAGHIQGFVPNLHVSNTEYRDSIKGKFKAGATAKARVLSITDGNILFTLKQGLVDSENWLTDAQLADPHTKYTGFVINTKISGATIAFYGDVKGWLSNKELNLGNTGPYNDPRKYFFRGEVINVWPKGVKNDYLHVSLNPPDKNTPKQNIKVGFHASGIITGVNAKGMDVEVTGKKIKATLPMLHLTNNPSLCSSLLRTYKIGDNIDKLLCLKNVGIPVVSRRECLAKQRGQVNVLKFGDLKKHMVLRCSFERRTSDGIYVSIPIVDHQENIFIPNENVHFGGSALLEQQCMLAKIMTVHHKSRTVALDARSDQTLQEKSLDYAVDLLSMDLQDMDRLINFGRQKNWKLTQYSIGEQVECVIDKLVEGGGCAVTLLNGAKGLVAPHLCNSKIKAGASTQGIVIDYNFQDNCSEVCLKKDIIHKLNKKQDGAIEKQLSSCCMAEILLITNSYAVGIMKDRECNKQLVYLPLSYNENDNKSMMSAYDNDKIKILIYRKIGARIIGVAKKIKLLLDKEAKSKGNTKIKEVKAQSDKTIEAQVESDDGDVDTESDDDVDSSNTSHHIYDVDDNEDSDVHMDDSLDIKEDCDTNSVEIKEEDSDIEDREKEQTPLAPILSSVDAFYNLDAVKKEESSSDDDEEEPQTKKRKTLSAKEKEYKIAQIEKELENPDFTPQSAAHFDRLILKNRNSSKLWLAYIAMHVSATEINKAKAVGKRALEEIDQSEEAEKFNIWVALLGLENTYGTKESFDALFDDAIKYNDSLEIYLSAINTFAACGKLSEMEEKIKKVRVKERQNSKMWKEIGRVYYTLGKFKEARNLKDAALKTITDRKRQLDIIIKFAILEFQYGELQQAINNFDILMETYFTNVNLWIIYVDQLIKKKEISMARTVLERATSIRMSLRNMRTLFQKFVAFEERYGNATNVERIKEKIQKLA